MTVESKRKLADVLEHAEVTKTIEHDWSGFNHNGQDSHRKGSVRRSADTLGE